PFRFLRLLPLAFWFRRLSELDVGAIAPVHHVHVLAGRWIRTQRTLALRPRAFQLDCLIDSEIGWRHILGQRRRASRSTLCDLHEGTEASDADADSFTTLRIGAEIEHRIVGLLRAMLDRRKQTAMLAIAVVELLQECDPLALTARDLVEIVFHFGCEVAFDEVAEVFAQQLGHGKRREPPDHARAL